MSAPGVLLGSVPIKFADKDVLEISAKNPTIMKFILRGYMSALMFGTSCLASGSFEDLYR
jgi:hypothetical protein